MTDEPRRISSTATAFWKRIFPPAWIALAGGGCLALILDLAGSGTPLAAKIVLGGAWTAGTPFFIWWGRRLKAVWLQGSELLVDTPMGRRRVHISDVREVTETRLQKIKLLRLELRREIPGIGREVVFIPPGGTLLPFRTHPLVGELRELKRRLAGRSSGEIPGPAETDRGASA